MKTKTLNFLRMLILALSFSDVQIVLIDFQQNYFSQKKIYKVTTLWSIQPWIERQFIYEILICLE